MVRVILVPHILAGGLGIVAGFVAPGLSRHCWRRSTRGRMK
jgi:hypothetical protein